MTIRSLTRVFVLEWKTLELALIRQTIAERRGGGPFPLPGLPDSTGDDPVLGESRQRFLSCFDPVHWQISFVHCFLGRSFIWSVSIEQMSIIVNGTKGPVLGVLRLRQAARPFTGATNNHAGDRGQKWLARRAR